MISKEKFIEIIERLENYYMLQTKIEKLFDDLVDNREQDFMNAGSICIGHESIVVNLLDNMFDTDMISWWIYDLDYGKKYKEGCIKENEINIYVSTAGKLYDYLIQDLKKKGVKINV